MSWKEKNFCEASEQEWSSVKEGLPSPKHYPHGIVSSATAF